MRIQCKRIFNVNGEEKTTLGEKNEYLTVGKVYVVLVLYTTEDGVEFQIESDDGALYILNATEFEIVSNTIPSNWEITCTYYKEGIYHLRFAPKAWNEYKSHSGDSFYDDIIEVEAPLEQWRSEKIRPEVVSVYFQEKDKMSIL